MTDRTPIVAGNWKMNTTAKTAPSLARGVVELVQGIQGIDVVLVPPMLSVAAVAAALKGSSVGLGAQTMHDEEEGAYTGEVSVGMVKDAGCGYVILGHSERRQHFGETDQGVNTKAKLAMSRGLTPIVCVGESLEEREADQTLSKVSAQVRAALKGIDDPTALILAYEPIWAIGTGRTASPEQAQQVHASIRDVLTQLYDEATARAIRIQYGGSVKPDNARALLGQPDIDGALVGGASLKAEDFAAIVKAAVS